ncbi:conserved hypothetical protein [Desulfonatronospira thiodismutans ASO3-1]|uniref:Uncharacterized protein n=1 Tax=Desulfonatronospira thiodismutans ASO3-1 TaxID=555779 RepID=D6SRD6_9BACT|nr:MULTISPECIES: hypothetical protein [Desulfonatronospira]EFI33252.1 conserved hypothetical protein [Desulfonatronospira thiodismutans ASO3-1]RQD76158.1 MAG: hypothetical protein D5S03_06970 [Desulfonatronospira sp. MSAO_Bac3]
MNIFKNQENGSVSREIERLDAELEEIRQQKDMCLKRKKTLMSEEKPSEGVFFNDEIHSMQMEALRLEVEAETRRKKINRLRLGYES